LDGVCGLIALFTTMEPILKALSKNLNQRFAACVVFFWALACKANSYKSMHWRISALLNIFQLLHDSSDKPNKT
jgi:hypothetical protein